MHSSSHLIKTKGFPIIIIEKFSLEFQTTVNPEKVPGRKADFREGLEKTIEYAKAVNCPAIHIMVGNVTLFSADQHRQTLMENLKMAESLLAQHNIKGFIQMVWN